MYPLGQLCPAALYRSHRHVAPADLVLGELQADSLVALAALDTGGFGVQDELLAGDIGTDGVGHQFRHTPVQRRRGDVDLSRCRIAISAVTVVQDEGYRPGPRWG